MITCLDTVSIYVENRQESLKFWTEKVGFEIKANNSRSLVPDWKERKLSAHFLCDNIEKTVGEPRSKGVKFT